jgi:hypothetical protein
LNISQTSYEILESERTFNFTPRGSMDVKGKGEMPMWFIS